MNIIARSVFVAEAIAIGLGLLTSAEYTQMLGLMLIALGFGVALGELFRHGP